LPSGLIFFLDFTHSTGRGGVDAGDSVYGGNRVGRQITGGVDLSDTVPSGSAAAGGHYHLGHANSAPTASANVQLRAVSGARLTALGLSAAVTDKNVGVLSDAEKSAIRFDADILASTNNIAILETTQALSNARFTGLDQGLLSAINLSPASGSHDIVRRLTRVVDDRLVIVTQAPSGSSDAPGSPLSGGLTGSISFALTDSFGAGNAQAIGSVVGSDTWGLEEPSPSTGNVGSSVGKNTIAEIDIKVDSVAVTAQTKKLKAKWSPELGQDLNAYHNLDAEVELTGILSEQIALEIVRELLGELVNGATAGTRYWSRAPGLFVDSNGNEVGANTAAPDFTGTVSEWYETLIETINDVSAQIHRKTLRGGANFVVCSPEVANILEFTSGFRASVTADQDRGTIGAVRAGSLSKKFDVYVDPYFLRNVILVGRKGSSFLESGFVYAPYVPLQVTPTIFGTEDFVPRKGVMTRYAKKMVRPDMYGLVVVRGLLGESGA
jgi:hypothetical protein